MNMVCRLGFRNSLAGEYKNCLGIHDNVAHDRTQKDRGYLHSNGARRSPFWSHFMVGCIVGLAIVYFQHIPLLNPIVQEREDILDKMFRLRNEFGTPHIVAPFVYIDIDDSTKLEPAFRGPLLPREQIAKLLEIVRIGSPSLVVLDVDLSLASEDDDKLFDQMERVAKDKIPLVVAHTTQRSSDGESHEATQELSLLEKKIANSGNPYFGAVAIRQSGDEIVRRFPISVIRCDNRKKEIEPSLPLQAYFLIMDKRLATPNCAIIS